jgi:hypothetical protein
MLTPTVTEIPLSLEPVTADSFAQSTVVAPVRHVMNYVESDLAVDMTLPRRRRDRAEAMRRRSRMRSILHPGRRRPALAA